MGIRHGCYCSDLWIDKTRYPKVTHEKRPLNKSQMARDRTAARSKLYPRVHWNHRNQTKLVAEQPSKETPKMPRGISELQEFLQRPPH